MSAAAPTALATAIKELRVTAGSHDRFAAQLKAQFGLHRASRQVIIAWEKGSVPTGDYRKALVSLGVPDDLWPESAAMQDLQSQMADMRAQLERIEKLVQRLTEPPSGPTDAAGR